MPSKKEKEEKTLVVRESTTGKETKITAEGTVNDLLELLKPVFGCERWMVADEKNRILTGEEALSKHAGETLILIPDAVGG